MKQITDFISELNNNGDENTENLVDFKRFNQSEIHNSLRQANTEKFDIELGLSNWGTITTEYTVGENIKAYYGSISANEISDWWGKFEDKIFEKNIRKVLGRSDVNDEMENTLQNTPHLFWYFNNGITIIADKISKTHVGGTSRDIGTFKLENFFVINGAQTVSSIGKFKEKTPNYDGLDNTYVNIRIIEIPNNTDFAKAITKANNRQNRIEGMDFASQDPEQQRIKNELILEGIEYSIMRSETFRPTATAFSLQEATISLAATNSNVALAVQVKSAIGKFFENLDKGIYKELFNPSISGYHVLNAVTFTRKIDALLNEKIKQMDKKSGKKYGILVHGNRMLTHLLAKKLNIHTKLTQNKLLMSEIDINGINDINDKLEQTIREVQEFIEKRYPDNFLATLFKNSTKCKELETYITTITH